MNIFKALISGATRSVRVWKGILIIWFSTLLLVSLLALPMRAGMNSVLGSSMITEKLAKGINIDVLTDFGSNISTILSSFSIGFFLMLFFALLMNVFFAGGLFNTIKGKENKFSSSGFFGGAGANFWSYLVITVLICLIIISLGIIIIGVPLMIAKSSALENEGVPSKVTKIVIAIFILVLPIFLLVADYARAWQASSSKSACFKAIGNGFRQTFRHFFSSYAVMAVVLIIQVLYTGAVLIIMAGIKPGSKGGLFLLFLLTQLMFIIKILLRTWRYGIVTSLIEQNIHLKASVPRVNLTTPDGKERF